MQLPSTTIPDDQFYYDWLKHGDTLFMARSGAFLIGETVLLQTAASLIGSAPTLSAATAHSVLVGVISIGGVLMTLAWCAFAARYVLFTNPYIWNRLTQASPRMAEYRAAGSKHWSSRIHVTHLVGLVPPVLILAVWILFLVR